MRLLAKSIPQKMNSIPDASLLLGHLQHVHTATSQLLDSTMAQQLAAIGLVSNEWEARFRNGVLLAAAIHDLGKANDHFQSMLQPIKGRGNQLQGLRHEWVTLWLLEEQLRDWLMPSINRNDLIWLAIECAVTGHHPAYGRPSPPQNAGDGAGARMKLYLGHQDFQSVLSWLTGIFGLGAPPKLSDCVRNLVGSESIFRGVSKWHNTSSSIWDETSPDGRKFISAVKACLMAGDVAGSALPKQVPGAEREGWISAALMRVPSSDDLDALIKKRLYNPDTGQTSELRPFQISVERQAGDVTIVRAGCGSGKTLAAYNWAKIRYSDKRLYFCYPTTGTATEGFRDYLFDEDDGRALYGADLFHGRVEVDLDIVLGVNGDSDYRTCEDEMITRIESLDSWSTPIVSCTADTVLGLTKNARRGLYSWPALAGAAFVFDEIHAYDEKLFGALLRFLTELSGIPVLLMTASLPSALLDKLRQHLKRVGRKLHEPVPTEDLLELEGTPRYRWNGELSEQDPISLVQQEMSQCKGKVLWICNTVGRAINAAQAARENGLTPLIYHSRFRYEDRVSRHKEIIERFKISDPVLAICTQVAEMSLDLSATMLISDLAPVPSLIQRLGRLNRRAKKGDATRPFTVIKPLDKAGALLSLPYTMDDLNRAMEWLAKLPTKDVTQIHLSKTWEEFTSGKAFEPDMSSDWLDGGPTTQVSELRRGTPGITVVLERDLAALRAGTKRLGQVTLPMPTPPKSLDWSAWERYKGLPVAPSATVAYNPDIGAQWIKESMA